MRNTFNSSMHDEILFLTVSLRPVFQAEGQRQGGVVLKEFGSEGVPPEVITFLIYRKRRSVN